MLLCISYISEIKFSCSWPGYNISDLLSCMRPIFTHKSTHIYHSFFFQKKGKKTPSLTMRPDTIMQVFTQSKVLLNDKCSRAKINTPQYNIINLVDISVSLMVCMKNDNQCFSRQSPEGVCIMNALKVLYYQQKLRMHPHISGR